MAAVPADQAQHLARMRECIEALRPSDANVRPLATTLRSEGDSLCAALPPQFAKVLHDLTDRLEAGALFAEESCSFSRDGLLEHFTVWADKAGQRLSAQATG